VITLIISDIDGTLLDEQGELPGENIAAFAEVAGRNVRIVLASIRKRDSAEYIARQLGLPCALICQGGATIYDADGSPLRDVSIPLDIALTIATLADTHKLPLLTTINETNYFGPGSPEPRFITAAGIYPERNIDIVTHPPTRFIVRGAVGVQLMMEHLANAPVRIVRHYNSDGTLYDAAITHINATKEIAFAFLCEHWQMTPEQALALGDAEADIGMLQMAGVGVAMGNAHPSVKAVADWVAPAATEAGAAAAVRRYALSNAG
jgi:hypothetical protein